MASPIEDQVVDFYNELFEQVFSERFRPQIAERIRRNAVIRQIDEAADAASQSLTRFFVNEQLTELQAVNILNGFANLASLLALDRIARPNLAPESVVEELLTEMPCPHALQQSRQDAVYRVALHSVVQTLMLVGRVMAEWERLKFVSTFELPRRIVEQLNLITEQLGAVSASGQSAADERFELTYRDYLLQRFHRVEAGTVRMTTSMDVDLRELFVMPHVLVRPKTTQESAAKLVDAKIPLSLAAAREIFGAVLEASTLPDSEEKKGEGLQALKQIKGSRRNVIVGLPGSGKSTLFEWLQLRVAAVEEEYILGGGQAIPLLLRVRQLDPKNLPAGATLIEKATASKDRTALMPEGWIERQMQAGRVLFMLDGLDETEPELCDEYIIPWLAEMCDTYPDCAYLVSSRPVGYPPGALRPLDFAECDLMDFNESQIAEYVRHWCTAIRLSQKEPKEEARREGDAEGEKIVKDFHRNDYVRNLAKNPLMLSAVCLVNYFERGKLPEDRAVLYKLCVEGLLHHWDSRRGIHSEFALEEKLRVCRELALAMQADDRAEYETKQVLRIFSVVLGDPDRADRLLEHIRYRSGLLIERRAGMFAFAHLTFQEYLAAQAVYEGNRMNIDAKRLAKEHNDGRWKEVIALYCGSSSANAARKMIQHLIMQPDTGELSQVLAEAYSVSGLKLVQDKKMRRKVIKRIAVAPTVSSSLASGLEHFLPEEVGPIANASIGKLLSAGMSEAHRWLLSYHAELINETMLLKRIGQWEAMNPFQLCELIHILHAHGSPNALNQMATQAALYSAPGPKFSSELSYVSQAEIALQGLSTRSGRKPASTGELKVLLQILRTLCSTDMSQAWDRLAFSIFSLLDRRAKIYVLQDNITQLEFASLARQLANNLASQPDTHYQDMKRACSALNEWATSLERKATKTAKSTKKPKGKSKASLKQPAKKTAKRRKPS